MQNAWKRFQQLTQRPPMLAGEVIAQNADGTTTIETPAGGQVRVRGTGVSVGQKAWYRDGELLGEAPDLGTVLDIELL